MYPHTLKHAIAALAIAKPRLHRHLFGGEIKQQFDDLIAKIGIDYPLLVASERAVAALRGILSATGGDAPDFMRNELVEGEEALAELDRVLEWTPEDAAEADARGWKLEETHPGKWDIVPTDEDEDLGDDHDSIVAGDVLQAAFYGDPLARKAVAIGLSRARVRGEDTRQYLSAIALGSH